MDGASAEKAFGEFRRLWGEQRECLEREIAVLRQEKAELVAKTLAMEGKGLHLECAMNVL